MQAGTALANMRLSGPISGSPLFQWTNGRVLHEYQLIYISKGAAVRVSQLYAGKC